MVPQPPTLSTSPPGIFPACRMLYSYKEKNKGLQPIYLVGGLRKNDSGQLEQRFRLIPEAEIEGASLLAAPFAINPVP